MVMNGFLAEALSRLPVWKQEMLLPFDADAAGRWFALLVLAAEGALQNKNLSLLLSCGVRVILSEPRGVDDV